MEVQPHLDREYPKNEFGFLRPVKNGSFQDFNNSYAICETLHRKFWKSGDELIDYDYDKETFETALNQDKTLISEVDSDWFDYNQGESVKKEREDQYLKSHGKFWKLGDEPVNYDYDKEIFDTALN